MSPEAPGAGPSSTTEPAPGVGPLRCAFLGPAGTFTEAALRQVADPSRDAFLPCSSVGAALAAVRSGAADRAMVPMENSVEGGVSATLDDIALGDELQIQAEVLVPVSFVLVARPGLALADVRRVTTHPHAWAQVRAWAGVTLPHAEFTPAASTAAGARLLLPGPDAGAAASSSAVAGSATPSSTTPSSTASSSAASSPAFDAAVCAPLVAEQTGLPVLAERIEDVAGAVTRFVLVSRPGPTPAPTGSDKTTLTVPLPDDHPGALREILDQFATRGVNLSRIESRPTGAGLGSYFFSVDLEGHLEDERVGAALAALHRLFPGVRFLGSYPRAEHRAAAVPTHTTDAAYRAGRDWVAGLRRR